MLPQIKTNHQQNISIGKLNIGKIQTKRNVSEAHDVMLADQKNSFLLSRDPTKVQNQKLVSNLTFQQFTPKGPKKRDSSEIYTDRYMYENKKIQVSKQSIEQLRKRMAVNKRTLSTIWKANKRTNGFTNSFMGLMFEDTSMNKEKTKKIVEERMRIKKEITDNKKLQVIHEEMK